MEKEIKDILINGSPRNKVIVSSVYIENLLQDLLSKFCIKKLSKGIFENEGSLSTFHYKIQICYSFGLIDEQECRFLDIIRKIRNKCAHSIGKGKHFDINFEDPNIIDILRNTITQRDIDNARNKEQKEKLKRLRYDNITKETSMIWFCYIILFIIGCLKERICSTKNRECPKTAQMPLVEKYFTINELINLCIKYKMFNKQIQRT